MGKERIDSQSRIPGSLTRTEIERCRFKGRSAAYLSQATTKVVNYKHPDKRLLMAKLEVIRRHRCVFYSGMGNLYY